LIHLILSLDYEIFGNGSGDVHRDMIRPTNRLLILCNKYGAKVTLFFEVGEYWAMKKAEDEGLLHLDYSPSQQIQEQIQNAVRYGHDVQLHLHPWWIGAKYKNGSWQLYPEYLRISDLPNSIGSENDSFSITGILYQAKRTVETIIKPACPDYVCLAYRAAMFWGQPSKELIKGMKKVGLVADSSVVRGLYENHPVPTDYRKAKSATGYWWTSAVDISQSGPKGEYIIEFPVYSRFRPYVYNFKWTKLYTTLKRHCLERADTNNNGMTNARQSTESPWKVLRKLVTSQPIKYDFCKLSSGDMIRGLVRLIKNDRMVEDGIGTPVVMLGHSKDFWNDRNLEVFLRFINKECKEQVYFSTLGELTKRILKRDMAQNSSMSINNRLISNLKQRDKD
jgi:hypothetical protein